MPQVFKIGSYWVYFLTNEGSPVEPIHVHIAKDGPTENATKVWITSRGKCLVANNNSNIPTHILNNMVRMIEARSSEVIEKWTDYFGEPDYFV